MLGVPSQLRGLGVGLPFLSEGLTSAQPSPRGCSVPATRWHSGSRRGRHSLVRVWVGGAAHWHGVGEDSWQG